MRPSVLALIFFATLVPQERPLPDYQTFAAHVKANLVTDEERQTGYSFVERRTEQKLDASGRPKDEAVKVFEVYPGLPGEDRYRRLIEENGKAVPTDKLAQQDRDRQKDVEAYARKLAVGSERERIQRDTEKQRRRYAAAVEDIFRIFNIHVIRRETIDGHDTIMATLDPKNDAKPLSDDGNIMRHFKARAWLSESDYELVRAEIEAVDDLSFGLGILARVHKGTVATFQRRKVNNEVWLPERVTWTASARVLLLKTLRLRGVSDFSNYRKFTVDTSTTYARPSD